MFTSTGHAEGRLDTRWLRCRRHRGKQTSACLPGSTYSWTAGWAKWWTWLCKPGSNPWPHTPPEGELKAQWALQSTTQTYTNRSSFRTGLWLDSLGRISSIETTNTHWRKLRPGRWSQTHAGMSELLSCSLSKTYSARRATSHQFLSTWESSNPESLGSGILRRESSGWRCRSHKSGCQSGWYLKIRCRRWTSTGSKL